MPVRPCLERGSPDGSPQCFFSFLQPSPSQSPIRVGPWSTRQSQQYERIEPPKGIQDASRLNSRKRLQYSFRSSAVQSKQRSSASQSRLVSPTAPYDGLFALMPKRLTTRRDGWSTVSPPAAPGSLATQRSAAAYFYLLPSMGIRLVSPALLVAQKAANCQPRVNVLH